MSAPNNIVLFHYPFSPYARRVIWYLAIRGIEYAQCLQPPVMPRADLDALGVKYRRIPVMAIGRDVYCDTRLILRKLEEMFPDGALGATGPEQKAIERLLEKWMIEGPVFSRAASLIPTSFPTMNDPTFMKDRTQFSGRPWDKAAMEKGRPESIAYMRSAFEFLETTLLADGRDWILKTDKPSLADIEAIWPFDWLADMKGSLPPNVVSAEQFPRVFSWIARWRAAVKAAKAAVPKPVTLKGPEAAKLILEADFAEPSSVDANDPLGLTEGVEVEVYPTDSGFLNRDRGPLVTLTQDEVAVASRSREGGQEIRIHAPRTGFRVTKVEAKTAAGAKL
ncbi:hypothetical protein BU16DRAFT_93411 [Lophium mytilinum]|uniref:GST C-terminal domain-containing protein n=1 Tax=Lophium mytilinum TaxID=390894 RepID=A0A6A6QLP1_9PEZI|nr:hypothetical protein BU16DRAFT_93411 [Lophium mytilinum]